MSIKKLTDLNFNDSYSVAVLADTDTQRKGDSIDSASVYARYDNIIELMDEAEDGNDSVLVISQEDLDNNKVTITKL